MKDSAKQIMDKAMAKSIAIGELRDQHPKGSREWKRLNKQWQEANYEWAQARMKSKSYRQMIRRTLQKYAI